MHTSTAFTLAFVGLAMASPLKQAAKKDYVYDVVTDIVMVTVTDETTVVAASTSAPAVVTVVQEVTAQQAETTTVAVSTATPPNANSDAFRPGPGVGEFHPAEQASVIASTWSSVVVVTVEPTTSAVVAAPTTSSVVAVPTSSSVPVAADVAAPASTVEDTATGTSSLDPADATSTDPVVASLYHHNVHRTNHSAPVVSYNTTLASYAATVAASCVYAHDLTPGGGGYGQNIAVFGETGDVESLGEAHEIAQASTDMWYNGEINEFLPSYYGEANPDFSNFDAWGHFSQMVWASTEEIGCASQYCDAGTIFSGFGSWFTVCNYGPEGNMGGEYGTNVLKPLGDATITA